MSQIILDKILEEKIIAIIRGISSEKIVNLVEALHQGGISCVEVTFDHTSEAKIKDTLTSVGKIKKHFGDTIYVGAGTVMTSEQVHQAVEAGAEYIISPNVDADVIEETKKLGKVSIPGALTSTEIAFAYKCGADIIKLFPAGDLGVSYLKSIKAPLKHIPILAVGGVNSKNCVDFMKAGAAGIGVGGNLVSAKLVDAGKFDEIVSAAKEYKEVLKDW